MIDLAAQGFIRDPTSLSAILSIGFNPRPKAIGCRCSKLRIQTWQHPEDKRTLPFLRLSYSKGHKDSSKKPSWKTCPQSSCAEDRVLAAPELITGIIDGITLPPVKAVLEPGEESACPDACGRGRSLTDIWGSVRKKGNAE